TLSLLGGSQQFLRPSISPDGNRVAVSIKPPDAREKLWIYDVTRGTRVPVESSEAGSALYRAIWSPGGKQGAYRGTTGKISTLFVHAADGSGEVKQPGGIQADLVQPTDWSHDGRYLAIDITKYQGRENWEDTLTIVEYGSAKPILQISDASDGKFSPD